MPEAGSLPYRRTMPPLPTKSLFWARLDTTGSDHALIDDQHGLTASGIAQAVDPIPYTCRYDIATNPDWESVRLNVEITGAGWSRGVRLTCSNREWRITTTEFGDLDTALRAGGHPPVGLPGTEDPDRLVGAIDPDLGHAPLFNTLPLRRLGLADAEAGTERQIQVVMVLVPSLLVMPAEQVYTVLEAGRVRFTSEGFTTELDLDPQGYVRRYPGLAQRAEPR